MTSPFNPDLEAKVEAACAALRTEGEQAQRRLATRASAARQAIRARAQEQIDDADRLLLASQGRAAAQASDRSPAQERHGITVVAIDHHRARLKALINDLHRCRRAVGIARHAQPPAGAPALVSGAAQHLAETIARDLDRVDAELRSIVAGRTFAACRPAGLLLLYGIVAVPLIAGMAVLLAMMALSVAATAAIALGVLLGLSLVPLITAHHRRMVGVACERLWEDLQGVQAGIARLDEVVRRDPRASDRLGALAADLVDLSARHAALVAQATASADRDIAAARQREVRLQQRLAERCERAVAAVHAAAATTASHHMPAPLLNRSA